MKRNIIVSLLIITLALGMQSARAQSAAGEQYPASAVQSNVVDKQTVSAVEVALQNAGYYVGKTDGEFTGDTRTAIESFQRENVLTVTGTITPEVLKALGLQ
jgi:peptidoglycan hydrolase-like protein with peptidoglycan-binding domain